MDLHVRGREEDGLRRAGRVLEAVGAPAGMGVNPSCGNDCVRPKRRLPARSDEGGGIEGEVGQGRAAGPHLQGDLVREPHQRRAAFGVVEQPTEQHGGTLRGARCQHPPLEGVEQLRVDLEGERPGGDVRQITRLEREGSALDLGERRRPGLSDQLPLHRGVARQLAARHQAPDQVPCLRGERVALVRVGGQLRVAKRDGARHRRAVGAPASAQLEGGHPAVVGHVALHDAAKERVLVADPGAHRVRGDHAAAAADANAELHCFHVPPSEGARHRRAPDSPLAAAGGAAEPVVLSPRSPRERGRSPRRCGSRPRPACRRAGAPGRRAAP